MDKSKRYYSVRFAPEVIDSAVAVFSSKLEESERLPDNQAGTMRVVLESETWNYDSLREFIAELPRAQGYELLYIGKSTSTALQLIASGNEVFVRVELPDRKDIEAVFWEFERELNASTIITPGDTEPITVFIGHGHSDQWRDLKDHLQDQHGFRVVAYEIGPRAGKSVKDVLEEMLGASSFALLVLTGEDLHVDGEFHARENVVHELGLFQGRLGFQRAIALLEEGCKEFSNILGVNQLRFAKGNIREVFGDVIATIRREFQG